MITFLREKIAGFLNKRSDKFQVRFTHNNEDHLRAIIRNELRKVLSIEDVSQDIHLSEVTDNLAAKIIEENGKPKIHKLGELINDHMRDASYNFYVACSYACLWEFKVKILAQKLGVSVFKSSESRNKKQKNLSSLAIKKLENIIEEIKCKTKKINIKFNEIEGLRDSLVHGNLQELRQKVNSINATKLRPKHKGNVFVFTISKNKITNLSESLSERQLHDFDLYSWFLECSNSQLMCNVIDIFSQSMQTISILINFISLCFDQYEYLFEKVIIKGEKLSEQEINSFLVFHTLEAPV